jgi:hypothetical protein
VIIVSFVVVQTTLHGIAGLKTGKPERVSREGQGGAPPKESTKSHHCNNCSTKETVSGEFNICSVCKLVRYCSRNCQKKHWDEHKTLCRAIKNLYTSTERGLGDSADENVFISHLTPSQRNTVAKLVGIETDVLWDTGAHV